MAHYLPPALMQFFQPRPPAEFRPPLDKQKMPGYTGIAQYTNILKNNNLPLPVINKTKDEELAEKESKQAARLNRTIFVRKSKWDPNAPNSNLTGEPYKTLFVGRLAYNVTEEDLKHEFSYYGPIVSVRVVRDKKDKPRGYAFVEFSSSKDLTQAYKDADGRKINGRRILVDVERGRTVKNWTPRRLAGGLGATRAGGKDQNQKYSGRYVAPSNTNTAQPSSTSSDSSSNTVRDSAGPPPPSSSSRREERSRYDDRDKPASSSRSSYDDRDRNYRGDRGDHRGDRNYRERDREHYDRDREPERDRERGYSSRSKRDRSRSRSRSASPKSRRR